MAAIVFGSFQEDFATSWDKFKGAHGHTIEPYSASFRSTAPTLKTVLKEREQKLHASHSRDIAVLNKFFTENSQVLAHHANTTVRRNRNGLYRRIPTTYKQKVVANKKEEHATTYQPHVITSITIAGGKQPSTLMQDEARKVLHTTPTARKRITYKRVIKSDEWITGFIKQMSAICKKQLLDFEIITNKAILGSFKRRGSHTFAYVRVNHMRGVRTRRDLFVTEEQTQILRNLVNSTHWQSNPNELNIKIGDSGMVLKEQFSLRNLQTWRNNLFIVRGRCDGVLLDARSKVTYSVLHRMVQYSSVPEKFWAGYSKIFMQNRPQVNHQCTSDLDVEKCGEVAALLTQAIVPMGRITCKQCISRYMASTDSEKLEAARAQIAYSSAQITAAYPEFPHANCIIRNQEYALRREISDYDTFGKIKQMIGERTESPFSHLNRLNELLVKGNTTTTEERMQISRHLLELSRYQLNRTENMKTNSIKHFRNKISAKTHQNLALMCDNQLDKNGNFVWGERGYHAKRFFSNFFETIDRSKGYKFYENRQNPNGSRKLAVNNLIMSTNFEALRLQMEGESIESVTVSDYCTSKRNGNYVYPCCCVTLEDGRAALSEIRPPTKNHLVIGNSGEPKLIDLPDTTNETMYIAKEGYCYVNIFLAMLINVNESDAKSFTKQTRDILMPTLGKWPSLMDVATACHFLTVLFPETRTAELPRILVDHKQKAMHVIDSYGSLETGFHILKANTVAQLTQFASNSLESEMKHYLVGGLNVQNSDHASGMRILIKSIYRPALFQELMHSEPHLIVLAVLSPSVLMALFNSGSLEIAMHHWITADKSLTEIVAILTLLATKVSAARVLGDKMQIIEAHAKLLLENTISGTRATESYTIALDVLTMIVSRLDSNKSLDEIGYATLRAGTHHIMEKNYQEMLEQSWKELNWLEKFSAIRRSRKQRRLTIDISRKAAIEDSNEVTNISLHLSLKHQSNKLKTYMSNKLRLMKESVRDKFRKTLISGVSLFKWVIPDIIRFINVMVVLSVFLAIIETLNRISIETREAKHREAERKQRQEVKKLMYLYDKLYNKIGCQPTKEEFLEYVHSHDETVLQRAREMIDEDLDHVHFQAKRKDEAALESVVAFVALVMMIFDSERSDCVYKVLNKLKNLVGTVDDGVYHQSLDDIRDELEQKNLTIDFDIATEAVGQGFDTEPTFTQWWTNQLNRGNTITHYRTEGFFMEFTRVGAQATANQIAHNEHKDILLRGAVGSGKSTGLPFYLSKHGKILLLEPTRPLAENVCKQLRGNPFQTNATLRMRGMNVFGSSPITIMTSGFALHFYANNPLSIADYDFVIFDECHVLDAQAMAFRCLLQEYTFKGKIIKVSATPPGREVEFTTQYPVKILMEQNLSHIQFVNNLGTKCNSDVLQHGYNILVYVASYSEVDTLSKALTDKKFKVTKVDGRTMKMGNVEIITTGTPSSPHFIVATNIIENGVTLDIDVVVDFGTKVVPILDEDNRMVTYHKESISFGERIQRLGRVGRHQPGTALRIGTTMTGLTNIPVMLATEAAFLCFTYKLPVMTSNVSSSILGNCTVKQAITMMQFELSPFFMQHLVRFDGSMHPVVHNLLKGFKLRDSSVVLNKFAIPNKGVSMWSTAGHYERIGARLEVPPEYRIPFYMNGIPERLYIQIWEAVVKHKHDAGLGRITSVQAAKIAYTLQTDIHSIPTTIKILDSLIAQEQMKKAHFEHMSSQGCSSNDLSLNSIVQAIRRKYSTDHTSENIEVLQRSRAQILEFSNLGIDASNPELLREFTALDCIYHQSTTTMSKHLKLKGHWNKTLITHDFLVVGAVTVGGAYMLYKWFVEKTLAPVYHQGYNKRSKQKLKFRNARDAKVGREVFGDDSTMEHYFGEAYRSKDKKKGRTHGMGKKSRKFVNMYGYDPADFSFVRFVDPLTGATLDDSPFTDINIIQEHFGEIRDQMISDDKLEPQHLYSSPGIEAYYVKDLASKALKVDLTVHNPLAMGNKSTSIAGFPEREGELRQTGPPVFVDATRVPSKNEEIGVEHESKSLHKGVRDYNPISTMICKLTNESDGFCESLFGLGFGCFIITNQHLFKRNNGRLIVQSHHGEFVIENTAVLKLMPCEHRDVVLIWMPKDFPPFPQKLKFRKPIPGDRICMVGSNFQSKSISSTVSESSAIYPVENSHFWKHWISTKDGQCGLPLVCLADGAIVGIHSLSNLSNTQNYFADLPENFEATLKSAEAQEWIKKWKYNPDKVRWGPLQIHKSQPDGLFKISKLTQDLQTGDVYNQSLKEKWMYNALHGNLKAMAECPSQLVTKHVVNGKCALFDAYLSAHPDEKQFFKPLLGAYGKSRLNREAYIKDITKYATVIEIGKVDFTLFEKAEAKLHNQFRQWGFQECDYVTDSEAIFSALNMKSAVGALYSGKKREYFETFSDSDKEVIIEQSCRRLYTGKLGIWNGSLKAEVRAQEKIMQNKTRTFTAAPLDTLLAGKVCVDDFNNQFYTKNIACPWSVGMTKFYGGWNELLEKLPEGWVYCDADGSQFDSSLSPYLINAVLNLRLEFMEDWDVGEVMLRNLYTEIVYTPISTPDGTIIKKFKGNNSGQPSTVVDNTLMVILAMYYSLLSNGIEEHEFDQVCVFYVNGDDLLIAVNPEKEDILNTFTETFRQLGLKYEFDSRTRNKSELWFMSHQGLKYHGIYIPKLEPERIVSILEWDRSKEPVHRLEAICAAMIESWGYTELTHRIRKFYSWVLEQAPYNILAREGKAPYLAETALKNLYTGKEPDSAELLDFLSKIDFSDIEETFDVYHQNDRVDAGAQRNAAGNKNEPPPNPVGTTPISQTDTTSTSGKEKEAGFQPFIPDETRKGNTQLQRINNDNRIRDRDIDAGTTGVFAVPRLKVLSSKLTLPRVRGNQVVNLAHLLQYKPEQVDLSNARATREQFNHWYDGVKDAYELDDNAMQIVLNGLMVWCIENGTSPNINGTWVMMDGEEQVAYPIKPLLDFAQPTFRQIMAHFSDLAEAYIEGRNRERAYMPRYGLQRNLTDMSLARYAFDFYEVTSKTSVRAREAHMQMKAAAVRNAHNRMFGIDGNVGTQEEDTERHTAEDVNRNMHTLLGVRGV